MSELKWSRTAYGAIHLFDGGAIMICQVCKQRLYVIVDVDHARGTVSKRPGGAYTTIQGAKNAT